MILLRHAFRLFLKEESGQVLPMVTLMMVVLIGMTGFVVDAGRALYVYRELQASCDAAALAGAATLPASTAVSTATQYSSLSGDLNYRSTMPNVTMVSGYPKVTCLNTLVNQGMACVAPANGNAMTVKQQITLPMYFMVVLGIKTLNIGASSTSAMRGSTAIPYNVVIVVDTTGSMNSLDLDSNCSSTRLNCALTGVQTLLQNLSPCASSMASCGTVTSGNVANAVDRVSVFTFPGVTTTAQAAYDYDCSTSSPQISPYSYPTLPIYQIVAFSTDYRSSDTSTTLTGTSNLVRAANGKSGCVGIQAVGGEGTYYAGVIYAAQAALLAQSSANSGTQNVLIVLSDGDASAKASALPGASPTSGTYPSVLNQCQQAVTAAQAATAAGTHVYTVAYGATSSGCSTDASGITPCQTMQRMASVAQNFYSDYTATGGASSCVSASQPTTNLNQIFSQIANDLTVGRLIPDNTQ
jgi:Flp pilus assembly protein TadG